MATGKFSYAKKLNLVYKCPLKLAVDQLRSLLQSGQVVRLEAAPTFQSGERMYTHTMDSIWACKLQDVLRKVHIIVGNKSMQC